MKCRLSKCALSTWLLSAVVLLGGFAAPMYADNGATITLKTTKPVGEKIMLQITALDDNVTIEGVGSDAQWQNSRFVWYTVQGETITIKGNIKKIKCASLSFSAATFENCSNLQEIDCGENFIKTLDVRACPALENLYVGGSNAAHALEEINAAGCTALVRIYAPNNSLKKIDVSGCTALEGLTCSDNKLETLDLSSLTALRDLICNDNQLVRLDLTPNKGLKELRCSGNKISELVLTSCPLLKDISCGNNQLKSIDLSGNKALASFNCAGNNLTRLDLSNNTSLATLVCSNNQIEELVLDNVTAINAIKCSNNKLKKLDLKKITGATVIECYGNLLEELDVTSILELESLECSNNKLTQLNVTANTKLTDLFCSNNKLTSLDVTKNKLLSFLYCAGNELKRLDLSQSKALTKLDCSRNKLSSLDLSAQTGLTELLCFSNRIKAGAMAKMTQTLRNHPAAYGDLGMLYVVNGKDAQEANRCHKDHVKAFVAKNWRVYDWNDAQEERKEVLLYAGADPLPMYKVTLKGDEWGTIATEDDFVDLTAVEEGSVLTIVAQPKSDKYELKQLLAGGVDITTSMSFKVQGDVEVVAKFGEVTALEEVEKAPWSFYPNPVHDVATVEAAPHSSVLLYNMEGNLLFSGVVGEEGILTLDMRSLAPGVYLLSVEKETLRLVVAR